MGWLEDQQRKNAERLLAEWPEIKPGMFVQLDAWFGDVWAEITSAYTHWDDHPTFNSVNFVRYDKYGVERKEDSSHFSRIRKFATREEINFATDIIHTPNAHHAHGRIVEWPEGKFRRDIGGYEQHPTMTKEESRKEREVRLYGRTK